MLQFNVFIQSCNICNNDWTQPTLKLWHGYVISNLSFNWSHDDIVKWKHLLRYMPFVREIHWSPVDSPPLSHPLSTQPKATGALFQYQIRRLTIRFRKISKPSHLYLELFDRSEIWQAPRQHCCRWLHNFSRPLSVLIRESGLNLANAFM